MENEIQIVLGVNRRSCAAPFYDAAEWAATPRNPTANYCRGDGDGDAADEFIRGPALKATALPKSRGPDAESRCRYEIRRPRRAHDGWRDKAGVDSPAPLLATQVLKAAYTHKCTHNSGSLQAVDGGAVKGPKSASSAESRLPCPSTVAEIPSSGEVAGRREMRLRQTVGVNPLSRAKST